VAALRTDAARSRARILDAARERDVRALRLNDVARDAGVGVGTVYRHFPNVAALVAALTTDTLERMRELGRAAAAEPDAGRAFEHYLRGALALQLADGGLQSVLLAPVDDAPEVREAKAEIFATFEAVLRRAQDAGAIRRDLDVQHIEHLVCGVEYAVRLGEPADRDRLFPVLLAGLRAS
jgi:AcrR family transcriptional regulator